MHDSLKLLPGALFVGEYRIVRRLSGGGMGAVYVAEQSSTGMKRALKVMHPELVRDQSLRERFVQEARVGARIQSDHVVQVIGAGVDPESGTPWIAMELLDGQDLDQLVAMKGPAGAGEALVVFRQLCHALGAAHQVGVVHRDLKPENVFLAVSRHAGERYTVKVLDFGIAKVIAEAKATVTDAVGTPLWMAPEQTEARGGISPATDVWALGLLAFWLMTGRHYWRTADTENPNVPAILRELLFDALEPASARAEQLGAPGLLPRGFDAWFARCVARESERRYATAHEAFAALEPILASAAAATPTSVPPTPIPLNRPRGRALRDEAAAETLQDPASSRGGSAGTPTQPASRELARRREEATLSAHLSSEVPGRERRGRRWWLATTFVALAAAGAAVVLLPDARALLPASLQRFIARSPADAAPSAPGASAEPSPPSPSPASASPPPPAPTAAGPEPSSSSAAPSPTDAAPAAAPSAAASARPLAPHATPTRAGGTDVSPPALATATAPRATQPFDRAAADAAMARAAGSAHGCHAGQAARVSVSVVWGAAGKPVSVSVANAPTAAVGECIRSRFAAERIPAIADGAVSTTRVTFDVGG